MKELKVHHFKLLCTQKSLNGAESLSSFTLTLLSAREKWVTVHDKHNIIYTATHTTTTWKKKASYRKLLNINRWICLLN